MNKALIETLKIPLISFLVLLAICKITVADDSIDKNLLEAAVKKNYTQFVELLEKGANPNRIFTGDEDGWVMCIASRLDDTRYLEKLIERSGDVNLQNRDAMAGLSTPLACAADIGNHRVFEVLTKSGAIANYHDCEGCRGDKTSVYFTLLIYDDYSGFYKLLKLQPIEPDFVPAIQLAYKEFGINTKSEQFQWRAKAAVLLQEMGYDIDARYQGKCLTDVGCLTE